MKTTIQNKFSHLFIVLAGLLFATVSPAAIYYIHNDHLATPKVLTDQNQTPVWTADAAPFGDTTATGQVIFNLRFPGQYFDQETGLHYNYFRYYDPSTGRYITSDPIGLQGGLNTYTYASSNPIRYSDRSGLCVDPGGEGIRYCLEQWIPYDQVWGFRGDGNRGPRANVNDNFWRTRQLIFQDQNGAATSTERVNFTTRLSDGETKPGTVGFQNFGVDSETCPDGRVIAASNHGGNRFPPLAPKTGFDVSIFEDNAGNVRVSGSHNLFPSLEIWQYGGPTGRPELIYYYDASANNRGPMSIFRSKEFGAGYCGCPQ